MNLIKNKIVKFTYNPLFILSLVAVIGLFLRLLFFRPELLIRQDALSYLSFASDLVILNHFPPIPLANIGWSLFLSIFFSIFHYNNFSDYSTLQQSISIMISVLTIYPMYFLCRKFFSSSYSLIGASLLIFEPHLLLNSLRGLIEPFYVFLIITSLVLFLNTNKKLQYSAFAIAGFCTIVRAEGIIIFLVFSIMFLKQYYPEGKKIIIKYMFVLFIFLIIIIPISELKIQSTGTDGTISRIKDFGYNTLVDKKSDVYEFSNWINATEVFVKRLLQSMIPYFALFVPFGMIIFFKKRNHDHITIIVFTIIYLISVFRVYSVVSDIRLLFGLYPIFCIFSIFTIKQVCDTNHHKNIFLILLVCGILVLSWFFLYNNTEIERELEVMKFSKYISDKVKSTNNFFPESGYVYGAWASSNIKYPILSSSIVYTGPDLQVYEKDTVIYLENDSHSIEEYINKSRDQGLTHLIVDDNMKNRSDFFKDLYYNEDKYPYLIKEFDSFTHDYKYYHVKLFKIDYQKFDLLKS